MSADASANMIAQPMQTAEAATTDVVSADITAQPMQTAEAAIIDITSANVNIARRMETAEASRYACIDMFRVNP